jgi:sugar/nucleoside kinase (ribokinase family)
MESEVGMSLLVAGSIGIDTVETPQQRVENVLGGSAAYFAYAASYFTQVWLVSVVGEDFPPEHRSLLAGRGVNLDGLETAPGLTFRWTGRYHENMVDRETLEVDLNVFGSFDPKVPEPAKELDFLFLANGAPEVQLKVLNQMRKRPRFVAMDSMDLWIEIARPKLEEVIGKVDALVINDSEVRKFTEERELLAGGRKLLKLGVPTVIIKKGEHGALVVSQQGNFALPAYPLESVQDPTGAGDSFAGGLCGYLASHRDTSPGALRRAIAYGAVVASFTCEDFSMERLKKLKRAEIDARYQELLKLITIPTA